MPLPSACTRHTVLGFMAAVLAGGALSACGSTTKTVSVSGPASLSRQGASPGATAPSKKAPTTGARQPSAATHEGEGSSTRSGSAPAFTEHAGTSAEGLQSAVSTVRAHGYTPNDPSQYHESQTLRVLVGTRTGSGDGYAQQAFFFVNGHYIGTDASAPSAGVKVVAQGDTEVTLAYPLYRPHDPLCCPGGGETKVRFQLNDGRLVALDPIPPTSSTSGLSRQ